MSYSIIITGIAGFIGFHLATALSRRCPEAVITGIDNLNSYYNPALKKARIEALQASCPTLRFLPVDITSTLAVNALWQEAKPAIVIHLAAQAGVRYSLEEPQAYIDSNITGFLNILEACRQHPPEHLLYASSSSVYGLNIQQPFRESDITDSPASIYGATKKANELMAHSYAHLFGIPATGLRFFTVYGEWGRPDMAYWKFADAILQGKPIAMYNHGNLQRDFTYIGDIVEGITRLISRAPTGKVPHQVFNIGNSQPVRLQDFIAAMEKACGQKAVIESLPMQPGDVYATYADCSALETLVGTLPHTPLETGLARFMEWFRRYR